MSDWHQLDAAEVTRRLGTDAAQGLSEYEAGRRIAEHGFNELMERGIKSPWVILWEQLTATMVVTLIIAAIVSAAVGDYKDALAIIAIVVLNAVLGFNQEYKAEKAMAALKKLSLPTVRVRRDGRVREISARELVPGDIALLEAGSLVPADCRLLETVNLRVHEAALTGESEPVGKDSAPLGGGDLPLGDRRNMAYMGTLITMGRGRAVVTETGMETELGRIATMIQTVRREPTPLQRRLNQLGRGLAAAALAIVSVIFLLGLARGEELRLMFLTAVSLAVAAVPEGLPAVVTIALALGVQRMLKRRALIRKLPAVETLGSVTVICSDKTGTLTENRMTVTVLDVAGNRVDLTEYLRRAGPQALEKEQVSVPHDQPALGLLLAGGALCNDAMLESDRDGREIIGEPTEGALLVAAARLGLKKGELERAFPRLAEQPFDPVRRRMTTVHKFPSAASEVPGVLGKLWGREGWIGRMNYIAFTKGAVDGLLDVCDQVWVNDHPEPLGAAWRGRITAAHESLAQEGVRVLGVAYRSLQALPVEGEAAALEREMVFIGMAGMIDPARPEVKNAVLICKAAGIRPVMITGDHPLTARHIARELGIAGNGQILTGQDLARLSDGELREAVQEVSVYARVSPEHKLRIVEALQARGNIVAMTGDGVNDAPALRKADVGVAMGVSGTEVSKEAADMVLLDDNFATIVAAVEEGRAIYDNIRKVLKYLLTGNTGEILLMLLGPLLGMPLPLVPLQILWINLVTDGLPALALSVEVPERDRMRRPPHHPDESIFARGMGRQVISGGVMTGMVPLAVGYWYWLNGDPSWQTMVFNTLILAHLELALAIRSERDSFFRIGPLSNQPLLQAIVFSSILQLAVVYVPFLRGIFGTTILKAEDLALSVVLSTTVFWGMELDKWLIRRRRLRGRPPSDNQGG